MRMATPAGRPSYAGWLDQIAQTGRTDEIGLVAMAWWNARTSNRPRLSAVKSVNAWLSEHEPPGVANLQATLHQLEQAYHSAGGVPAQADGAQPSAPPQALFQAAAAAGQVFPGQQPVQPAVPQQPAQPAVHQQPSQDAAGVPAATRRAEDGSWFVWGEIGQRWIWAGFWDGEDWTDHPPLQPAVPAHPWQMVMLAIERLRSDLAPILALAAEIAQADALGSSALAQPTETQLRAQEIAKQQGWTPGPAFTSAPADGREYEPADVAEPAMQPPAAFYGQHVVQPNFAQMAAHAEDAPDDEPEQ